METVTLAARLLLASVFLLASIGKLLDRDGSRDALSEFGLPAPFVPSALVLLPVVELVVGVTMVFPPTARVGAIVAAMLLGVFSAGITNALLHHRRPDCHCFGQIHSAPAGAMTLARNGVLLVIAIFVGSRGSGPAVDAWVAKQTTPRLVSAAALSAAAVVAAGLRYGFVRRARGRQRARLAELESRSGLPVGSRAPDFDLPGACGQRLGLGALQARGNPVLLIFADADCCACQPLLPFIAGWQESLGPRLTIAVISNDSPVKAQELCHRYGISDVLLQTGDSVADAYQLPATPTAVIVGRDGEVASETALGANMIHILVRLTLRREASRPERWEPATQPA